MKRSTAATLLAILLLAVLLRLLPLLKFLYWGSDFGEYYALTRAIAQDGALPTVYRGWGVTYPYFPGLFVVNGAFVLAGMTPVAAAAFLVPILSAFAVLPLFLLAARVTGDDLAALAAAAILATLMFHVFPTSHAIPAALADLLLVGALLLFVNVRRSPAFLPLLVLTAFAIVVTHHLTTYVLLLVCAFALVLRAALNRNLTLGAIRFELAFLAVLAATMLGYWAWYATSLWTLIVTNSPVSGGALVLGAVLAVVAAPIVLWIRRRSSWRFRPRVRTVRAAAVGTALALATTLAFVYATATLSVPGTSLRISLADVPLYLPMLLMISFSAAGRRTMDFAREGPDVTAWFVALVLSLVVGTIAAPEVLIPLRHLEYFAIPFAILAGAGLRWTTKGAKERTRTAALATCVLLVVGTAAAAYPPSGALGHQEGIAARSVEAALWMETNADGLVAADHRLSTVVFGFGGVDATWDRETRFWHTENVSEALAAMDAVRVPRGTARVTWVAIDADLRAGVLTSPFAPALPLTAAEAAKFSCAPFHRLYDSGDVQVYWVNWGRAPECP